MMNIAPDLLPLAMPVEVFTADPNNARAHDERNLQAIMASLARFGQRKPIVCTPKGKVIAGNGTLEAARRLGATHIAAVRMEASELDQMAYAIADNRTAELATWDQTELSTQLQHLVEELDDIDVIGFSESEAAVLIEGWSIAPLDVDAIDAHDEDGKHGVIKVVDVDLDARTHVAEVVREALRDAGYGYEVKEL